MKKIILTVLAIEFLMFGSAGMASPVTVISDHFDDGTLDPAWLIQFHQATGWTYTESGTTLNVRDIAATEPGWASIGLIQDFAPLSDFNIDFWFSWDSEGSTRAMQNVLVQVYGQTIKIAAGYSDGWIPNYGAKYGEIGGTSIDTGPDSLPGSGSALVNISRTGNVIEILWNGDLLLSGTSDELVSRIALAFSYRVYDEGGITSFFGNEAIDLINVEGTIVTPPLSGWVYMPQDAPNFGYSLNEEDLVYFYSFDFVPSFNLTTGGWFTHMPTDWVYFDWPFYYELVPGTPGILWFALPPESGLWVYHFSTGQWEILPQIIP